MKHFIIGSRLMVRIFPNNQKIQKRLKPDADYDILIDHEPTDEDKKYFKGLYGNKTELHFIPLLWVHLERFEASPLYGQYDIKNIYFTLKASHVMFSKIHKKKTLYDIFLMSEEGCTVIEPLFYKLYDYWCNKFGKPWRADFTKESADFFNDAVSREHVHDELHETVKLFDKPVFKYLQNEGQTTVTVYQDKFDKLPYKMQLAVFVEEARVLAIERDLLTGNIRNQYIAYIKWVEALIDRIADLWQVPFICNNFAKLLTYKDEYYVTK